MERKHAEKIMLGLNCGNSRDNWEKKGEKSTADFLQTVSGMFVGK